MRSSLIPEKEQPVLRSLKSTPNVARWFNGRRLAVLIEWCFGAAVLLSIIGLARDVIVDGYLPDPFLHSKADSFNDWYNPAYWANNHGAYSEWGSIYPPFSFVFLRFFSRSECYAYSVDPARTCDPTGIILASVLTVVNFVLVWLVFHKIDKATAFPRALAVGLGFPVLFAWERANLIIPCFTAFILAYGNILKSARLKAFFAAITLNFKPYLILVLAGRFLKRDWVWLEWSGLCFVTVYALSYTIMGSGDPISLLRNTALFEHPPGLDLIGFATTYTAVLTIIKLPFPIVEVIGSNPIEMFERWIPPLMYIGAAGVLACLAHAAIRPAAWSRARISGLTFTLFLTLSTAGLGYSLEYALFFVFFEKWSGPARILALTCAYLLCVSFDFPVTNIYHDFGYSFIGQRNVHYDLDITFGQLVRPGLLLLVEYGLVCASARDIFRDIRTLRNERAALAFS